MRRPYLSLAVLTLLFALPGLTALPPLDRDESRFAQATAQMLESGDFVRIQFQDQPRHKKPVGIHWLQALSVSVLSDVEDREIWAYRVPSLMAAVVAVLMTFWGGRRLFDDTTAFVGAAWLASLPLVAVEADIAKTDAALLAVSTAALMATARLYMDARQGAAAAAFRSPGSLALIVWLALGAGVLLKGPLLPTLMILTLAALSAADGDWRWLKRLSPLPGLVIAALVVLPWSVAIWQATDGAFFREAFWIDMAPKLAGGAESHGAPPGIFTLASPLLLWPASLVLLPAAALAYRHRTSGNVRFCLAWILPMWLVFELTPTKLPHYILPLLPPLALLAAHALREGEAAPSDRAARRWPLLVSIGLWLLVLIGMAAGLVALTDIYGDGPSPLTSLAGLLVLIAGGAAAWTLARGQTCRAFGASLAAALVFAVAAKSGLIPRLTDLQVSPRAAAAVERFADPGTPVAVAGYAEPSLVFLLGTQTRFVNGRGAAGFLLARSGGLALVEASQEPAFLARLSAAGRTARRLANIDGLNYSRGTPVMLRLYTLDGGENWRVQER